MKNYFSGKKHHLRLTALVLSGLLYGSTASADTKDTPLTPAEGAGGTYALAEDEERTITRSQWNEGIHKAPYKYTALTNYIGKVGNKHTFQDFTIDLNGYQLDLSVTSEYTGGPATAVAALFAGPENHLTITDSAGGGSLCIAAEAKGAASYVDGIHVEKPAGPETGSATVNFEAEEVAIESIKHNGTGAARGVYADERAQVNFKNLKIMKVESAGDEEEVSGVYLRGDESAITIEDAWIEGVKGSALRTRAGDDSKLSVKGGYVSAEDDTTNTKQYYAVAADKGEISLDGVNVYGNMRAGRNDEPGTIDAIFRSGSSFTGAVNKSDDSTVNLTLKRGAWTHTVRSGALAGDTSFTGSHLTKFTGGDSFDEAGIVNQGEKDITIDTYSGHTVFLFDRDDTDPKQIKGGKVTIREAEANSEVVLGITKTGSITELNVAEVLKGLANKLFYMNYANGHLKGTMMIGENLIGGSATWRGDITFEASGQGTYLAKQQTKDSFTTPITSSTDDTEYIDDNVRRADGKYVFTKERTTITTSGKEIPDGTYGSSKVNAAVSNAGDSLNIILSGCDLKVDLNATGNAVGIASVSKSVSIDQTGNLEINSVGTGKTSAVLAIGGGALSVTPQEGKVIKLRSQSTTSAGAAGSAVVKAVNGRAGVLSAIGIRGQVDIEADGATCGEAVNSTGGSIDIAGGSIRAVNGASFALHAAGDQFGKIGKIFVNFSEYYNRSEDHKTVIEGNLGTHGMGGDGIIHLGLNTEDSSWTGDYLENNNGTVNLWLGNNATWTGKTADNANLNLNLADTGSLWKVTGSSHIKQVSASTVNERNVIDMTKTADTDKVNIDDFSGKAWFYYDNAATRDEDTDRLTVAVKGAEIHVKKAAAGSEITIQTAAKGNWDWSAGASNVEKNLTAAVAKALANKLWYEDAAAHGSNLTLTVRVSEGLTTSAAARSFTMSDGIHYDAAHGGQADYSYTPLPEPAPSTEIRRTKTLTKNFTAAATEANAADGSGHFRVSGLYAGDSAYSQTNPMIVDMNGYTLQVKVESSDQAVSAVMLRSNAAAEIKNDAGQTLTLKAIQTGTKAAEGIYVGENASLKSKGPVVIDEVRSAGHAVTGILAEGSGGRVTIDGPLTIHALQEDASGNGSGVSALNAKGSGSSITVTGDTDIQDVKGSVLKIYDETGTGLGGTIHVDSGTLSAAVDADKSKQYRVVQQNAGTINVNMQTGLPGTKKTTLKGDVYVVGKADGSNAGTLNVALTTNDSSWHGAALYDEDGMLKAGNFNLWLQNGASWTNEQLSSVPGTWNGSHVTKLTGGTAGSEGAIFQNDTKPLTIDNYDGHLKVFYRHTISGEMPTIHGGDTIIGSAASGSVITLVTDKTDLAPTAPGKKAKNLVSATLNALANKLWYTAYKSGENHLTGQVMIADGLTTSSASLRLENVTFDHGTGQGRYEYTPSIYNQTVTAFTTPVTGNEAADTDYVNGGVLEDAAYTFSEDTSITGVNGVKGSGAHKIDATIIAGKTLTITATGASLEAGSGSDITLSGGKTVMTTTGAHVITTAAGSNTSLKGGFYITGGIQNAGTLTLSDQGAESKLTGDIDNTGTFTLSLTGAGSAYHGAVTGTGDAELTLGASALWENKGASKLRKFTGVSGSAVDMTNSANTTIADYSGSSTFYFPHAAGTPTTMQGGAITITRAEEGSKIILRTNQAGLNVSPNATAAERNLINQTLDALANKLYYTEKEGTEVSHHLTGTVEIAEGLTSSSAARSGSIAFDTVTGQGSYDYVDFGALKKNVKLTRDEVLSGSSPLLAASAAAPAGPVTVDLNGYTLTIQGTTSKPVDAAQRPLAIRDTAGSGKVAVSMTATGALVGFNAGQNSLVVDAATDITGHNDSGVLTAISAASTNANSYEVKFTKFLTLHDIYTGNKGENNGNNTTAIQQAGRGEFTASGGMSATNIYGTILHNRGTKDLVVNGGDIKLETVENVHSGALTTKYLVAHAQTTGKVCINTAADGTAGTGTTKVKGDVMIGAGHAYLSLTNRDSAWTGTIDKSSATAAGTMTLNLANGAQWTNQRLYLGDPIKAAPVVERFTGGSSLANAGIIDQRQGGDLTLKNYSGNTIVWYGHTIANGVDRDGNPAKVPTIQGGKITITSAAAGSTIHLRTDGADFEFTSNAVAERNLINATLNALANKLYYEDYVAHPGNLKAYVEISEGLIGSGVRISKEITTFAQTNPADGTDYQGNPFNTENKQGAYVYVPDWVVPETQQKADFTTPLTGDWDETAKTGADMEYAKSGIIHDGKYGFTQDTVIHPAAGSAITNTTSNKDIAVKVQGANLTVNGANWAIEAAAGHKIDLTGDKAVTLQGGTGSISVQNNAVVNVMAAGGLTLAGNLQNGGGTVNLDGGNTTKSTFAGALTQNSGALTLRMAGAESAFTGDIDNQKGHILVDLTGERTSFRGAVRGPGSPAATTEIRLGKTAGAHFTDDSKVTTLSAGDSADVKVDAGKTLTVNTMTVGNGSAVTAEGGSTVAAATVTATGSVTLAANGAITADTMNLVNGGTLTKTGSGAATIQNTTVTKETTLNATTSGLHIENMSLGNALLKNTGAADVAIKNLNAASGGRLFLGSDATVDTDKLSGDLNVLKNATMNADGTVTTNHGKFRFRQVDMDRQNRLTLSAVGMTLEDTRTGTTDEQEAKKRRNHDALLSLYRQSIQADVNPSAIVPGDTYTDADGNQQQGYRIDHLTVNLGTMESLTASGATAFGNILFDSSGHAASVAEQQIEYGDYETMIMQSTKGAMTSSAMVWRNEMNDLMKRMGDLRLSPGDLGGWVRFYKGRTSSDKDKASFRMNYTTIQAGYDWKAGKDWRVGIAGSYMKGSSNYATGSGDNKAGNFAVYGTWTGKSGQYVDLIAKVGRVANEFRGTNAWGNVEASGDYHAWGESVSAEYGRRFKTDGSFYFEPQVEFTFGRLNGVDYDMQSNGYGTLKVCQSGMNSAIGRLGVAFGQEMEKATWFVKASLYHEFAGDMDTTWEVAGSPTKYTQQKGKDTWLGLQLGGTVKLNDRLSLYGDFEKTFSGDIKTDWRVDAGLRWSF